MTTIANAPQKVTSTPQALAGDVAALVSIAGMNAVFLTEVETHARGDVLAAAAGAGWTVSRQQGSGAHIGLGECAIITRDAHYVRIHATRWVKVWKGGGKARFAHAVYALVVVAETATGHLDVLTGLHTKAHVEGIWAHLPLPARVKAKVLLRSGRRPIRDYLTIVHAWREGVMHIAAELHADDVIAAPDGNLDAHKPWVTELLHRAWPGMHLAATKQPDLGRRTVGWVLTTMKPTSSHVVHAKASDHDAGIYSLARTNAVPVTAPQPPSPPPFEQCTYNGALMDQKTKAFVQAVEKRLGYPLTIVQGCYNPGGVAASAGTHDLGGVIDLAPFDWQHKVHAVRALGAFGWHRLPIPGLWSEHIHFGIRDHGNLSAGAAAQQVQYDARPFGFDGLADHAVDKTWHPQPPVAFAYPPKT